MFLELTSPLSHKEQKLYNKYLNLGSINVDYLTKEINA